MVDEKPTFEELASDREKLFVDYYELNLNGAQSARSAGFTEGSARQQAHRLLTKDYIRAEIDRRLAARVMSATDVLARWSAVADTDISPYLKRVGRSSKVAVDVEAMKRDGLGFLIKSVKNTKFGQNIEFRDVDAALEKMGKVHKLLIDRQEHSGPDGGPIKTGIDLSNLSEDQLRALASGLKD